jgi:hypothetical protein
MSDNRCPGQDMRNWTPEDICYQECSYCHEEIEFWKDEPVRACPSCGKEALNPRQAQGCADWCKHTRECPGARGKT